MRGANSLCGVLALVLSLSWAGAVRSAAPRGLGPGAPGPDGPAQFAGRHRGWRGMNFQRIQQRMLNRIKQELKVTDAEWAVLKSQVQQVQQLQFESRLAAFMWRFHGHDISLPANPLVQAMQALAETLRDPHATVAQLKGKLAALRLAREAAATKLMAAQRKLRGLLTLRQEAVLVEQGLLDY